MNYNFLNEFREWNAKWIWEQQEEQNTWVCFRKRITVDNVPERVTAYISAESRYWLYINGKNVVFEGSLKRGFNLEDSFYDEVEIADFLREGENTIAVLACYWGYRPKNFSTNTAGKAGFVFECNIGGKTVISDKTWKVLRNAAYLDDTGKTEGIEEIQPNYRIPEFNVYYDARLDIGNWTDADHDDSLWQNATELGEVGCEPWNRLHKRCIPLWKNFGLKDYLNSEKYIGHTTVEKEVLELECEYNCQLTPYLEVETDIEGLKINIYPDTHVEKTGAYSTVKGDYVTKKGIQSFESLAWINGERVYYEVPAGVTIKALKYRETGYNSEFVGHFECDDELLNRLWKQSRRTLYITMRDNYMDCPDRERAQWWGDVTNEMMMMFYCLDENSYNLYEKAWYTKLGMADSYGDSVLRTVVPTPRGVLYELPAQELAGVCGVWQYYMYTGNKKLLQDVYPYIRNYLMLWSFDENNELIHRTGSWDWHDWGDHIDYVPLEYAWYYRALGVASDVASEIGVTDDLNEFARRRELIKNKYDDFYCEDDGFKKDNEIADDRCNAVAVLADLNTEGREALMNKKFNTVENSSPYMEKYVLDAMCKIGSMKDVQDRIRRRYEPMVNGKDACTTLWEHFGLVNGTKNHAWSGGPLITMSKHMAGVEPTKPGFEEYKIEPRLGYLKNIDCAMHTVKGDIHVICSKNGNALEITVHTDVDADAYVIIPQKHIDAGVGVIKYGSRYAVRIKKGSWSIKCANTCDGRYSCVVKQI